MKPHKWAKVIKAWADGHEIQYKPEMGDTWHDMETVSFDGDGEYRVKPVEEARYINFYLNNEPCMHNTLQEARAGAAPYFGVTIKVTIDPCTKKATKVELV